jgi:uncharacterized protein DUF1963
MTVNFPTLIVSRRPRQDGSGWHDAQSWFGGKPQLGGQPWPRGGARQMPFYFLAQIDLAEVGREVGGCGSPILLPDGALAFFIGSGDKEWDCALVHVPRQELGEPTEPPPDAPAVLEPGGDIFPATFDGEGPRLFPRWPVAVTALDVEFDLATDADEEAQSEAIEALVEAQVAAVERRFTRRKYFFSAKEAHKLLGEGPWPSWWHSAGHYATCLRRALRAMPERVEGRRRDLEAARAQLARLRPTGVAGVLSSLGLRSDGPSADLKQAEDALTRREALLAELERPAAEFQHFVRDVGDWVRGMDPWQPMPPEAAGTLASTVERGRTAFGEFTRFYAPRSMDDLETETLVALATADDRAYAMLPEAVRTLINREYLLPTGSWHQMFGRGVDIQGNAAYENEGNVMLLQLVYDDMMLWRFGDMGAFQFWIPPDDLARGNWAAVRVTFECS